MLPYIAVGVIFTLLIVSTLRTFTILAKDLPPHTVETNLKANNWAFFASLFWAENIQLTVVTVLWMLFAVLTKWVFQ